MTPASNDKTTEQKIDEIHDALIRLEPVCKQVEKHEKALYNGGWGIVAQTKVLWALAGGAWVVGLMIMEKKLGK